MPDLVVTVPKDRWFSWCQEGDLPGDPPTGDEYLFFLGGPPPAIDPGERVYVVAHGLLRGYAPLVRLERASAGGFVLVRAGGARAITIHQRIPGFRGWKYRFWAKDEERPFPDWRTAGVGVAPGQTRLTAAR